MNCAYSFSQIPRWYENLLFLGFHQISLKFQRQLLFLTLLSIRVIVYSIECYLAVTARAGITLDSAGRWRESKRHGTVSLEHWMPAASRQEPSPVVSETQSWCSLRSRVSSYFWPGKFSIGTAFCFALRYNECHCKGVKLSVKYWKWVNIGMGSLTHLWYS